ncbi:protein-disulfide reductase DsbD family protein [Flavivirga amylovorans]|uniref:Protein-disulfide reductase DsbD family protein n=1 Tax=Flavivirga amylovorans TaxID=870486 RepID=A0ABT8X0Q9_9FLAO|nr:protein-disulfide reductase DsbD domain-containing protein [Flavivirga amylovorans]MDO5987525.1 protein-disulfide reductase DsbD family protein [Flavivirga amylovorans]
MKVKKTMLLYALFVLSITYLQAQILEPAKWSYTIQENSSQELELTFKVSLDDTWYVYATDQNPDLGPIPTTINLEGSGFKIIGEPKPIKVKTKYDEIWEGDTRVITESGGGFTQRIKVLEPNPKIKATINYTVCSMETGQCVFGEQEFDINLNQSK